MDTLSAQEENFFKVSYLVLDVVPTQLRNYFKQLWDTKYPRSPWLDTSACGQRFLSTERGIPKHLRSSIGLGDRTKWDGTTLFAVLLFSSHTLITRNTPVYQAIDSLRSLRNAHYGHLTSTKMETTDYQRIIAEVKAAFKVLNWPTNTINDTELRNIGGDECFRIAKLVQEEEAAIDILEKRVDNIETAVDELKAYTGFVNGSLKQLKTGTGRLWSGGGGAPECNLTGRCPFFKNLHNPFRNKNCISIPCFGIIRFQKQ